MQLSLSFCKANGRLFSCLSCINADFILNTKPKYGYSPIDIFSNNTFLISFGFCAALSFVLAVLINLVRIAYSSCILSEATFEKVKQLKPSVRNHLLWLLNRPLATHFSLNFFQTLFLILTFLFAVLASSNMGMEIWIVCSIIGAVGLLLILVCMLTTSFALSHSVAVLKSTTRLTGMLVRIATFVFRLKKRRPLTMMATLSVWKAWSKRLKCRRRRTKRQFSTASCISGKRPWPKS